MSCTKGYINSFAKSCALKLVKYEGMGGGGGG